MGDQYKTFSQKNIWPKADILNSNFLLVQQIKYIYIENIYQQQNNKQYYKT